MRERMTTRPRRGSEKTSVNARIIILLVAILASAFALASVSQQAQAKEQSEEAEERAEEAEERAEEAGELAEEQAEEAEERAEEAEKQAEERNRSTGGRAGDGGSPQTVTLSIQGDPGTEFSGTCTVGGEEKTISGEVPRSFEYKLDGRGIECEIRHGPGTGTMKVVLTGNGIRSVQQVNTPGGTINFSYANGGISSSTTSTSSSTSSVSTSQASRSSSVSSTSSVSSSSR